AFFRLLQEALQNAIKHANPTLIQVKLEITDHCLSMTIKDDGDGFDPKERNENSFGIIGMRERVEMFDGELKIDSKSVKEHAFILMFHIHQRYNEQNMKYIKRNF